jgi:hypothetical protein
MEIQGSAVKDFHALKVWQKAHELTLSVYRITASFPREELYGLTTQSATFLFLHPRQSGGGVRKERGCRIRSLLLHRHGVSQ